MKNDRIQSLTSNINEIDRYLNNIMNPQYRMKMKQEKLKRKMGKELKRNLPF